jgi:hypothetical protein
LRRFIICTSYAYSEAGTDHQVAQHLDWSVMTNRYCDGNQVERDETERRGWVVNTPTSHLGCPEFKSRPRDRLFWLTIFMVFLSPSRHAGIVF